MLEVPENTVERDELKETVTASNDCLGRCGMMRSELSSDY